MFSDKVILFDCMETLIEMHELPGQREYALWTYEGSGTEEMWNGFDEFLEHFSSIQEMLKRKDPHIEYDIRQRYKLVIEEKMANNKQNSTDVVEKLVANYWHTYKKNCYVSQSVIRVLDKLAEKYRMGVVSNFIVAEGIEELLRHHRIDGYFDFVVTSVHEGWRKPHSAIYQAALRVAEVEAKNAIFIGDDYINDFLAPRNMGFETLLYDRNERYPQIDARFTRFEELLQLI